MVSKYYPDIFFQHSHRPAPIRTLEHNWTPWSVTNVTFCGKVFWKGNPTKCKLQLDPILVKSPKNLQKQHEENSRMYPLTENVIGNNRHRRSASAARAPTRFHSFYQERGLSRTMELEMNKTLRDTLQDRTFEYQTILYWTVNSKLNLHSIFFVHFRWKNQSTTQTKNWNGIICMVRKSNKF